MIIYLLASIFLILLCLFIVIYYSYSKNPYYCGLLVFISFLGSLSCFLLLLIDISNSFNSQPTSSSEFIRILWIVLYYIGFFGCWIILPFAQEYQNSGHFTTYLKIKDSLKINAFLLIGIFIGAIILTIFLIILNKFTITQLPSIFATIVNLFGTILVCIFVGFGLISFPKQSLINLNYKKRIKQCHYLAQSLHCNKIIILQQIDNINKLLITKQINPIQKQIILNKISSNFQLKQFHNYSNNNSSLFQKYSSSTLHNIIKRRIIQFHSCQNQLENLVQQIYHLTIIVSKNRYYWYQIINTIIFIITILLSGIIFLAQLCTFINWLTSINILVFLSWNNTIGYILNSILFVYMTYICVETVFKIKIYRIFSLHKRYSSSSSLFFTTINLSRICFPLCYNCLLITGLPHCQFLSYFGTMNVPIEYSAIFPIIMVIFAILNIFDIYDKILGYLGLTSYAFDSDQQQEKNQQGRNILIQRYKKNNELNKLNKSNKFQMIQLL